MEQADFLHKREEIVSWARDIKNDYDPTFGQFIEGTVLASDPLWQYEVEQLQTEFSDAIDTHRQLVPPEPFVAGHSETQAALEDCLTGWTLLYEGATQNNQQLYQSGIQYITSCNDRWQIGDQLIADAKNSIGSAIDNIQVDPASLGQLEQTLEAELGDRVIEVSTRDVTLLYIRWNILDRLTDSAIKQGAKADLADILTAVHESNIPYSGLDAIGYFPLIDQYGNIQASPVVSVYYSRSTLDLINWDNIMLITDNLYDIADSATIHPDFRD